MRTPQPASSTQLVTNKMRRVRKLESPQKEDRSVSAYSSTCVHLLKSGREGTYQLNPGWVIFG